MFISLTGSKVTVEDAVFRARLPALPSEVVEESPSSLAPGFAPNRSSDTRLSLWELDTSVFASCALGVIRPISLWKVEPVQRASPRPETTLKLSTGRREQPPSSHHMHQKLGASRGPEGTTRTARAFVGRSRYLGDMLLGLKMGVGAIFNCSSSSQQAPPSSAPTDRKLLT